MSTKKDKSYQVRLQCQKCNKFIDVDLYVKITERNRYGEPKTYEPTKIPRYLQIIFESGRDQLARAAEGEREQLMRAARTAGVGSAGVQNPSSVPDDYEPVIVCKTCQQVDNLTE